MALTDDIRAHYKLEEGAGAAILDYFSDYDLAITGTVSSTLGKVGNGRTFVASGSSRGDAGARSSVTAIPATLTCWFRLNSTGVAHALMACCTAAANTLIVLGVNSSNQLVGYGESAGVGSVPLAGSTTLTTGVWYHAAFVAESGAFKIYLDGSVEDTDTTALSISGFDRQYLAARFYGGGLGEYADADIDEATFFGRALDAADIGTLRAGGAGLDFGAWGDGLDVLAPYAVACWPLDEASGDALDSVGSLDLTEGGTGGVGTGTGLFTATARDFESGDSDYFTHADDPTLSVGDILWWVRFWVKLESKADTQVFVGHWPGSGQLSWLVQYAVSIDRIRLVISNSGTAVDLSVEASGLGSPSTGVWYEIWAWHDSVNNLAGIVANAGTPTTSSYSGGTFNSSGVFEVGRSDGAATPSGYLDALLSDVVLGKGVIPTAYQRALSHDNGDGVAFADWAAAPAATWPVTHRLLANPNAGSTWRLAPA